MQPRQYQLMYENENSHWWFLAKRQYIRSVLDNPGNNPQILDVGSGTGGLTDFLSQFGTVTSLEPAKHAWKFLKKRGLDFVPLSFDRFKTVKKFDLICFFDVLYHKNVPDDSEYIKKAFKLTAKRGKILITDCALPWFFSGHDRIMHARKRYLLPEMEKIVNAAGYRIIRSTYIYFFVLPLFAIDRILLKRMHTDSVGKLPFILNMFLYGICRLESRLLKNISFPAGSSFIIYAEKK